MGVKNLWDILDSCKKKLPLHNLQNKRVCIDLSCWMVQLQNVSKSHSCVKEKVYLKGLFHRLRALIALNCSLIFVTDGSIPAIKLQTYRRRLNSRADTVPLNDSTKTVSSLRRNMGSEFSCMIKEAKLLGSALGIPCLNGIEEAEAQCALLNYELLCDGCFTSDSDVFLFGARTVYRDICLGDGGYVICYEMEDIERNLGFGRNSLITLGLILGSDYTEGVYGLGRESACQIVKSIGDNAVLKKMYSDELFLTNKKKDAKNKIRNLKCSNKENICEPEMNSVNGCDNNLKSNQRFLHVIDAYLKPRCHQADSDAVQRVLVQHSFQRIKFQQICAQLFEWPPEKTDEYILPKIAERNLRQFANLRLTSSTLGLNLSLPQIPVACPLSEIIKPRKVQGKECYEVAWKDMDGLKSSIVPSDLVESACPEKIVEFKERKAHGKKPNRRNRSHKQIANKFSMEELDLKLKTLLLDVEQGDNSFGNATCPLKFMAGKENVSTKASLQNQKLSPFTETKVQDDSSKFVISENEQGSSYSKTEVIDLLSPSPQKNTCSFSKFKRSDIEVVKTVEVIHLSDSEAESSPEHQRRLRELRSFITSMKNDI